MCEPMCRAITALESEIKQINKFMKDLQKIDEYVPYDDEHNALLEDAEQLRVSMSVLYSRALVEHPELIKELEE